MSSSNGSTVDKSDNWSFGCSGKGSCTGNWSGRNIAAMVIGFVLFWPIGLVLLYWNIKGRDVRDLPKAIKDKWSKVSSGSGCKYSSSENSVFDEFQQTQHDRISELKEEIKNRSRNFREFRTSAQRRADEEEFKDFMSSNHNA